MFEFGNETNKIAKIFFATKYICLLREYHACYNTIIGLIKTIQHC